MFELLESMPGPAVTFMLIGSLGGWVYLFHWAYILLQGDDDVAKQ